MTLKKKLTCIVLSMMVAITFMPVTGQIAFADEGDGAAAQQDETTPEADFSTTNAVTGVRLKSYNYKSVTITWSAYEKAAGYQVYSSAGKTGKYSRICTTTGLTCYDKKNKKLGKNRYYKVRAYGTADGRTVYSQYSDVFAAKPNLPAPAVKTSGGQNKITVSWSKVSGARKYQVYRATSSDGKYSRLKTTKSRSYTGNTVAKNRKYYYKVRALRGSAKGEFCGAVEGMTILSAPDWITASQSGDAINVTWCGVSNAAGYRLYRSATIDDSGFAALPSTTAATSYTDNDAGLKAGTYYYKVQAYSVINGKTVYGQMTPINHRSAAVAQAASWEGCNESDGSHKQIIATYNSKTSKGKIGYGTAWCAAFVSAVAIKTDNTSVIPVDCYCPGMLNKFKSWGDRKSRSYSAKGGDVIFFDWNYNGVPDHVGMVYSRNGSTGKVTTIEGNYDDSVKYRTFNKGWSMVLAYAVPEYKGAYKGNGVVNYTEPSTSQGLTVTEDPVNTAAVKEAVETVETGDVAADTVQAQAAAEQPSAASGDAEASEQTSGQTEQPSAVSGDAEASEQTAPPANDQETVEALLDYIDEEDPAEESLAEESTYNAFLMLNACEEMGIEACVVTELTADGEEQSHNEILIDGELYTVDSSKEGSTPVKYVPEEIN